ncbi:MAG: hypothetical protein WC136_00555 [Sphaerochaeta sp.]|jgi:hypothetical protein
MTYQIKSKFNVAYINAKDSTTARYIYLELISKKLNVPFSIVYDSIIETKDIGFTTKRVLNV